MTAASLIFQRLQLAGWRQFASIDVEFHPRLTVLTGANGAGKSTLLNVLSRHVGVERQYLSVPRKNKDGGFTYWPGRLVASEWWERIFALWLHKPINQVGEITYSDFTTAQLMMPANIGLAYTLGINNQRPVLGIAIASHRPLPSYQPLPHIAFQGIEPDQAFGTFIAESNAHYLGQRQNVHTSLIFQIKNALATWAIMGEGNSILQANKKQKDAYLGFVNILKKVLPESLGFIELSVRPPDVVMVTKSGDFLIDAASGGVTALIEIVALIYACFIRSEVKGKPFVVTIDEPENHLHPSLQRSLFIKLVNAFPLTQFIIATHGPFIVSSLKDSNVYVLRYDTLDAVVEKTESTRISSMRLDYANRAGTASEILRDVLGVPTTLPQWVETDLNKIVEKYQTRTIDEANLNELKLELRASGLEELFSEALAR